MRTAWNVSRIVSLALVSFGLLLPSLSADEIEGLIDIDYPQAGEAKVELNLLGGVFSLAAKIMAKEEPEVSEFLAKLEAVKVRIYDKAALAEEEAGKVLKFYEEQLKKGKWEILARVRDKDSKVCVYSLTRGDIVSGIVVLVQETDELVVVNLAGEVDVTKLSQIDKVTSVKLDLPELNFKKRDCANRE